MAKVKVVIESDEAINVKVTKQPTDEVGMEKLKADIDEVEAVEGADTGGTSDATENA
ncbi:MAG: hypothetical protein K2O89_02455 [Clostridia bacterium]|nr:hypothetical protein [Clostridia bacterium]